MTGVVDDLETGLTSAEAASRLTQYGPNTLPPAELTRWPRAVAEQLTDPVVIVLLVAGLLTVLLRDAADASVIGLVLIVNTVLGAGQQVRSSRALAALAQLTAPRARVVRDGCAVERPAADLVPGDVLVVAAGDILAADGIVRDAYSLQTDEALVSGEALPVDRRPGDEAVAGSVVTRGRGIVVVTRTGAATTVGSIGNNLRATAQPRTPLQRRLDVLGRNLALAVCVVSIVVAGFAIAGGRGIEYSVTVALSLAVAAIPESLPAVVALSLRWPRGGWLRMASWYDDSPPSRRSAR